ncbi:MAG: ABC transporter ATP-binding protein [Saprospiraceae bacterium]
MSRPVIQVENLSKQYRLGQVGTGTISHDLNRWWHSIRGKEDPYLRIGETNDRAITGDSEYAWALKDINFEVHQGEVLGIIGKNGAGKSTLLKILSKVTGPTTGSIRARGRIASLLEVGTGFHPELTGRENIFLNGTILGMTRREVAGKLDEIVDFAGVARYLDTPVKRYSSGMMVRLGFAVAAHLEPEILIVDEVLAVGDAEFQRKAVGKMQEVSSEGGRTVLFVSHNMAAVQNLCHNGLVLQNGRIVYQGKAVDSIKAYLNESSRLDHGNLMDISNRRGTGRARFKSLRFDSELDGIVGEDVSAVPCGAKLSIIIGIIDYVNVKRKIDINIELSNFEGVSLTCFSTEFNNSNIFLSGNNLSYIKCEIDVLNLRPSKYQLSLWGRDDFGEFDYLQDLIPLVVEDSDFFKSGKMPRSERHGYFLYSPVYTSI